MNANATSTNADSVDVVVVGASISGCTAARLFAQAGARVALVERRPDPAAYKVACTHNILSSATPTIVRLGLAPLIEARGAIRTIGEFWTPYGGWIRPPADAPHGYCVTRRTLDPILRDLASNTPGVDLLLGWSASRLLTTNGRPTGVELESSSHGVHTIRARLVVGADGRDSTIARMARVPGRVRAHNRFYYFAYWCGFRPRTAYSRVWLLNPDTAAAFSSEDDLTVVVAGPHRSRLEEFRADPELAYRDLVTQLPDGPDFSKAERVSRLIGKLETPNVMRPAAQPGLAFVGDAALASDPTFGVGCGWAFQSAEWLVDETAAALHDADDLDRALGRYRRAFRRRLGLHHFMIADISSGRGMLLSERIGMRAAAANPVLAGAVDDVLSRRSSPLRLLDPRLGPRLLRGLVSA